MWRRKDKNQKLSNEPIAGQKFEHTLKSRTSELLDQIARTQSSPFFPIQDPKLAAQVHNAIADSLAAGENKTQCNARLSKLISDPKEADEIAHTEIVYAHSASMIAFGKETKAKYKVWYNSLKACKDCVALNEKKVRIDDLFGGIDNLGHPPLHKNCTCGMRLVQGNNYDLGL